MDFTLTDKNVFSVYPSLKAKAFRQSVCHSEATVYRLPLKLVCRKRLPSLKIPTLQIIKPSTSVFFFPRFFFSIAGGTESLCPIIKPKLVVPEEVKLEKRRKSEAWRQPRKTNGFFIILTTNFKVTIRRTKNIFPAASWEQSISFF